jgi:predicted nucleic acid-binding Zn ribbon protein
VGRFQSPQSAVPGQPSGYRRWHPCCRRCLLKSCERWFLPRTPQARFCSPCCRKAARRWRRWLASQHYRATLNGKEHRRDQARRYRTRLRQQPAPPQSPPVTPEVEPAHAAMGAEPCDPAVDPNTLVPCCEGQRPDGIPKKSYGLPCHRPGCYVLSAPMPLGLGQKFCSALCRQASRRVRQRESRLRLRRRRGIRPLCLPHRRPPPAAAFMSSHP